MFTGDSRENFRLGLYIKNYFDTMSYSFIRSCKSLVPTGYWSEILINLKKSILARLANSNRNFMKFLQILFGMFSIF